jgi:hypothetical protein
MKSRNVILSLIAILLITVLGSCVSLNGVNFDTSKLPNYNAEGTWKVYVFCPEEDLLKNGKKVTAEITQDGTVLNAYLNIADMDLHGIGNIAASEDKGEDNIYVGCNYKNLGKGELYARVKQKPDGSLFIEEGLFLFRKFGSAEREGTFTALIN